MLENIRKKFVEYMSDKGCNPISRDSLVSDTFPTCFTLSGGPNFVDRYLKQENPKPENSVVIQPCYRFWDTENIMDGRHLAFFEMAVTNSFNGIPREEMYKAHFDFLTKELGLNPDYFTVFVFGGGECYDTKFELDEEAIKIWEKFGLTRFSMQKGFGYSPHHKRLVNSSFVANTVEPVGGPRTEIHYGDLEIWTSVLYNTFVDFDKDNNRFKFKPIKESTIAAGFGLERVVKVMNKLNGIHEIYNSIDSNPFISDYIRSLVFLANDGAFELVGNKNSSRKTLLNRAVKEFFNYFKGDEELLISLITKVTEFYPELGGKEAEFRDKIIERNKRLEIIEKKFK